MDALTRLETVLHGGKPDRIPFVPYDNLVPRGQFVRNLRNRGMGLCLRRSGVWSETPDVRVETFTEGADGVTVWRTPAGSVSTRVRRHVGRIGDGESVQTEWMIKDVSGFEPVIFLLENTSFHADWEHVKNQMKDVGRDGIVRENGPAPSYDQSENYFGLANWAYMQHDFPAEFDRLLDALDGRTERFVPLVLESPAELVSVGSLSGQYSPAVFRSKTLPFYKKYVPMLKKHGKICAYHAHASNVREYVELIAEMGVQVVEAFTPPPVGNLSVADAHKAWGRSTVIWINFPETIFYSGKQAAREYLERIVGEDPYPEALVVGITEMGLYGIADPDTERAFKDGFDAIMDALGY